MPEDRFPQKIRGKLSPQKIRDLWSIALPKERVRLIHKLLPHSDKGMTTAIDLLGVDVSQLVLLLAVERAIMDDSDTRVLEKLIVKIAEDKRQLQVGGSVSHTHKQAQAELSGMSENDKRILIGEYIHNKNKNEYPVKDLGEPINYEEID